MNRTIQHVERFTAWSNWPEPAKLGQSRGQPLLLSDGVQASGICEMLAAERERGSQ